MGITRHLHETVRTRDLTVSDAKAATRRQLIARLRARDLIIRRAAFSVCVFEQCVARTLEHVDRALLGGVGRRVPARSRLRTLEG